MERLVLSSFQTGLETDVKPFLLNNDAFPVLNNAYIWRKRILRKRGTNLLGRLQRSDISVSGLSLTAGSINLISALSLQTNAQIVPGSIDITGVTDGTTYTDPTGNGILTATGGTGTGGTINYTTGVLSINSGANEAITGTFSYYPVLPVMGLRDFDVGIVVQPELVAFDTEYSYQIDQGTGIFHDTTFYKTTGLPFTWNGANYQQFWTNNYLGTTTIDTANASGCMWATNGNPGFHFVNGTYTAGSGTTMITFNFKSGGVNFTSLIVGDILWFNEWNTGGSTINLKNGTVSDATDAVNGNYVVTFVGNQTVAGTGIAQLMTNAIPGQDGIRWYDGDPTVSSDFGWVNFAPPLSSAASPQYLVGADLIIVFKNRLLFFGVWLSTSAASPGPQFYPNRVVYCEVGSPFYSLPLPFNISATAPVPQAWFQDVAGFGGFLTAPLDQQVISVTQNKDILICGFEFQKLKLIPTGDDSLPFVFQTINSDLGTFATYSAITFDQGDLSIGSYGIVTTTSSNSERIDLQIPDQVFSISINDNDDDRVCAVRDYQKEWVYFTYCPTTNTTAVFPSQTLLYNYRENNWAIFQESYTTYGTFRRSTFRTWSNIDTIYPTWADWSDPWDFGGDEAVFPTIVGGNQHGFVLEIGLGTTQSNSQVITAMSGITITSPDHGLVDGQYIMISGATGSTNLNGTIQQVSTITQNTFTINNPAVGTYTGGGVYKIYSIPFIQTKQFPSFWNEAYGMRLGTQRYLFDKTANGQVVANVYCSQDSSSPSNDPNKYYFLPYTNVISTAPENNLNDTIGQNSIWHRSSNSFSGDTIQLSITLSDAQIRNPVINEQEIVLSAIALDVYPGRTLAL